MRKKPNREIMNPIIFLLPLALLAASLSPLPAQVPDLTNGGVLTTSYVLNLGPTGLAGKAYHLGANTSDARQFLITSVDPGSPADRLDRRWMT